MEVHAEEEAEGADHHPATEPSFGAPARAQAVLQGAEKGPDRHGGLDVVGGGQPSHHLLDHLRGLLVLRGPCGVRGEEAVAQSEGPADVRGPGRPTRRAGRQIHDDHLLGDGASVVDVALDGRAPAVVQVAGGLQVGELPGPGVRELGEAGAPLVRAADGAGVAGELVPARLAAQHPATVRETGEPGEDGGAGPLLLAQPDQAEQPAGRRRVRE